MCLGKPPALLSKVCIYDPRFFIVLTVVLMNILIAMMANTYDTMKAEATARWCAPLVI